MNISQNINSTYKISENNAIITSLLFSKSKSPQQLLTNPGTVIDELNQLVASNQKSEFQKQFLSINSSFYRNTTNFKYAIHSSYSTTNNSLNSNLLNNSNENLGITFKNNNIYYIKYFNIKPVVVYDINKYSFKLGLNAIYNNVNFSNDLIIDKKQGYFIAPKITAIYHFNTNSNTSFNYAFNQILPEEDKIYSGVIQTGYRNFNTNELSLNYLKTHSYNLNYNFNDFFNSTRFSISINHDFRPNNYFYKTIIDQNTTIFKQFYANFSNKDYNLSVNGEKYFHSLRTTFQLETSLRLFFDNNIINNTETRKIKNKNFTLNFTAKRVINKIFILENKTFFLNSNSKVTNESIDNNFQMLTNQTKLAYKSKKNIDSNIVGNFISPNLKSNNNYFFLDYEISFTSNNKMTTYSLLGKNLTNNKIFTTTSVNDFSNTKSSHNLIERYVMLKFTFGF